VISSENITIKLRRDDKVQARGFGDHKDEDVICVMERTAALHKFRVATRQQRREPSGLKTPSPTKRPPSRILDGRRHGRLISLSGGVA